MKFAVVVFPGSNCDNDSFYVLKKILNVSVDFVWHKETNLSKYDVIVIPGGFSYGDHLRAGAIARFSPIMNEVVNSSKKGKPIIGICNGFQVLTETGLLTGSLMVNKTVKFISKNIRLKTCNNNSIFTRNINNSEPLEMPIAHKQGNFCADNKTIDFTKIEKLFNLISALNDNDDVQLISANYEIDDESLNSINL